MNGRRVLIYNPNSGDRRTGRRARDAAVDSGFEVRESEGPGETLTLAREAAHDGDPPLFSLDGGTIRKNPLDLACRPGAMRFHVGDGYDPTPREWGRAGPE